MAMYSIPINKGKRFAVAMIVANSLKEAKKEAAKGGWKVDEKLLNLDLKLDSNDIRSEKFISALIKQVKKIAREK